MSLYSNPAPHFKLSVQPVDDGLLLKITVYDDDGNFEEPAVKIVDSVDMLRTEFAKLLL